MTMTAALAVSDTAGEISFLRDREYSIIPVDTQCPGWTVISNCVKSEMREREIRNYRYVSRVKM